ncbi:MAG TPA: GDP-mannose 4,6-dehydratase [Candidatus Pacearchaeota archaeon]|nr:GDP-mannose 4,6-dehydratase [Candidatus Pacearchaeota archaeon]
MRILITGGAGFIGSHLADRLIKNGDKVILIDNLSTGKKENINPKAKFYKIDIQSPKISNILKKEKPEILFHLAAQIDVRKSVEDPIKDAKINILGSLNVIKNFYQESLKNTKKPKIIFSSTGGAIYGDAKIIPTPETYPEFPLSPYGVCKLTIEKYLNYYWKVFNIPYVALRYANVYGPRQNSKGESGVVSIFIDKLFSGENPIINGSGKQTRDFVFIEDIIEANILAMKKNKVGVYNIGTGKETDINTIFQKLKKITNSNLKAVHCLEKKGEQKRSCLDYKKAQKELSWKPKYNLDEGLIKTVEWFKKVN